MEEAKGRGSAARLQLTMMKGFGSDFVGLMQKGFLIEGKVGCSIEAFLARQLGLSQPYIESRITTIFLDGKPVDDIRSATIKDGSTVALSGAMPGLVGATLRRAGYYASLRSQISHHAEENPSAITEGMFVLKLFNVLAGEVGEKIFREGVWIRKDDMKDFIRNRPADFWERCAEARLNGNEVELGELRLMEWPESVRLVHLSIRKNSRS